MNEMLEDMCRSAITACNVSYDDIRTMRIPEAKKSVAGLDEHIIVVTRCLSGLTPGSDDYNFLKDILDLTKKLALLFQCVITNLEQAAILNKDYSEKFQSMLDDKESE